MENEEYKLGVPCLAAVRAFREDAITVNYLAKCRPRE